MQELKKMIFTNIAMIVVLGGAIAGGLYWYNQSANYVSTDNAQVTGVMYTVSAPASGSVIDWNGLQNESFSKKQTLGYITTQNPVNEKSEQMAVLMPQSATVVQNNTYNNDIVAAGTPLAYAYNLADLYVTANVDETAIRHVKVGDKVDIHIDAYPNDSFTGTVQSIGNVTASQFSMLPPSNTTGDFTKVTQVIPVQIAIDGYTVGQLSPGMSAEVTIHRNN